MTGTASMGNLTENDYALIGEYLKRQFPLLTLNPAEYRRKNWYSEELMERVVRVEEELKHQRELMQQGFAMTEKLFEQRDKRLDQIDKRLDQVDKRLDDMKLNMDRRFEQTEKNFAQVDKRLDIMSKEVSLRFSEMEKRFSMQTKILITTAGLIISSMGGMAALLR